MASSASSSFSGAKSSTTAKKQKFWYVDGVSCLGKTTFIKSLGAHGLKLDYFERVQQYPDFTKKSDDHIMQILYTSTFCHEVYTSLLDRTNGNEDEQDFTLPLFIDRSPVSEIAYELLFKHFNDEEVFESTFAHLEKLDMFAKYPTIFLIPHIDHAQKIVEQMEKRGSNLDRKDKNYVEKQIVVFGRIANRFAAHPNVRVMNISKDLDIYSEEYFSYVSRKLRRLALS